MERQLVESNVEAKIKRKGRGWILFAEDFLELGMAETINKALHRLKEKGLLVRLAHGIYVYPKEDKKLGVILPTIEEIAKAVARRDRAQVIPTGVSALNKLGVSTQVPMNVVYLTNGAPRKIRLGRRYINFKRTTPKNLAAKGKISGLAIQALREIGKENLNPEQEAKIKKQLRAEKAEYIKHDAEIAPAWIRNIMLDVVTK